MNDTKRVIVEDAGTDREQRRETYLLAARNPWLVWRLQAIRAGYTPPLLLGRIPPEMVHLNLGTAREEYTIDPLVRHAARVQREERSYFMKMFTLFVTGMLIFFILGFFIRMKLGSPFRIGFIDTVMPRVENHLVIQNR